MKDVNTLFSFGSTHQPSHRKNNNSTKLFCCELPKLFPLTAIALALSMHANVSASPNSIFDNEPQISLLAYSSAWRSDHNRELISGQIPDLALTSTVAQRQVSALLGEIRLLPEQAVTLGDDGDITAFITGEGNLVIAGNNLITLMNDTNDYTGTTTVSRGTLQLGSNNVLGNTQNLIIDRGAKTDLNGMTQTVGGLNGAGELLINNGNLTVREGGIFDGVISGTSGLFTLAGGSLTLGGNNTYTGNFEVENGAALFIGNGGTSGSYAGDIVNNGTLYFNRSDDVTYGQVLSGTGSLHKMGAGTLTLTNPDSSIVSLHLDAGGLRIAADSTMTIGTDFFMADNSALYLVPGANIYVGGDFRAAAESTIEAELIAGQEHSVLSGNNFTLDGNLVLKGYTPIAEGKASDLENARYRLIESATSMEGDFKSVTLVDTESPVDYLTLTSDKRKLTNIYDGESWFYTVGLELTWLAGATQGNGIFTLSDAIEDFDVDVALSDQTDAFASGWDGKTLTKNGEGTLILSAQNTYTGETLIRDGKLQMGIENAIAASGAVNVAAGAVFDLNDFDQTAQNITGGGEITLGSGILSALNTQNTVFSGIVSGAGSLVKQGTQALTLTNSQTYAGGTTIAQGTLRLGNGGTQGSITGDVLNNGVLAFNRSDAVQFDGAIDGSGSVRHEGSGMTTFTALHSYSGATEVINGTLRLIDNGTIGTGNVTLGERGTMLIASPTSGDYQFNNALYGDGQLVAALNTNAHQFDFSAAVGSAFTGTFSLNQGAMLLAGNNVNALAQATLNLGLNGVATITDNNAIGQLAFSGGQLTTEMNSPNAADILSVNYLNVDMTGAPAVPGVVNLNSATLPPVTRPTGNLLLHGNIGTNGGIQIVAADAVSTVGKQLTLLLDDAPPEDETYTIDDGFGHTDVRATYGYGAVTTDVREGAVTSAGLYVGYLLKVLESQSQVVLDSTGAANTSFGVQLTGEGDFAFHANNDSITLVNATNDYRGKTLVNSGTLRLGAHNALGQTSALHLYANTNVNINGFTQTIGELHTDAQSALSLNDGQLTVTDGGVSHGNLIGNGQLTLAGGTLNVTNANTALRAQTIINDGATAQLNDAAGLGSGAITLNGTMMMDNVNGALVNNLSGNGRAQLTNGSLLSLSGDNTGFDGTFAIDANNTLVAIAAASLGGSTVVNHGLLELNATQDWVLTNAVSGSGAVSKTGSGVVTLNDNYAYTGGTTVAAGTLALQSARAALSGGGPLFIAEHATLGGYGSLSGNLTNQGTLAVGSAMAMLSGERGDLTLQGNLTNQGEIRLTGSMVGNTLTIDGNYLGGGHLRINSVLADDNALTDKLIVQGDTSGATAVTVNNAGGAGGQTVNGIEIITVNGASDGDFALANRVVAGAYEYRLYQGSVGDPADGNWYLRSLQSTAQPDSNGDPNTTYALIRPEVGAYMANQDAAMAMFTHSLHDRFGDSHFLTGNTPQSREANTWGRIVGNYTHTRAVDQIKQRRWGSTIQLGGDVYRNNAELNSVNAGIMAGYGVAKSRNTAEYDGVVAHSNVRGYSVGVYGSWFADGRAGAEGPYLDSWLQHGWYHNEVNGERLAQESYHSRTFAGSLEGGWTFTLRETEASRLFIQPQAQFIYTDYNGRDVHEDNGTRVKNDNNGGVLTRVGVRLFGQQRTASQQGWQPFIEANWLHNDSAAHVAMNGVAFDSGIPKDRLEVKTGVEGQLDANWQLWGNVGVQKGNGDFKSAQGIVGVRYQF